MPVMTPSAMSTNRYKEALLASEKVTPQTGVDVRPGVQVKQTTGGIQVLRLHYSAHPERNPEMNPEWKAAERRKYTSQASWDREQEIRDEAGGGELVFADTLITHWDKIVITDPHWRPEPTWAVDGGMDYGRTNPTVFERTYVDHAGVIYFSGEYYVPGLEVWEHIPAIKQMIDLQRIKSIRADPSIFNSTMEQSSSGHSQERAKSVNRLYEEHGIKNLWKFAGDRSDVSFAERLLSHWANLDQREPTVKIVCRNYSERPQHGLHQWDCPNLLWELMRTRRTKLTAQQLLNRNVSEAIVDKDNHARDACKYVVMTYPAPAKKPYGMRVQERIDTLWKIDPTMAMFKAPEIIKQEKGRYEPTVYGGRARNRS